MSRPNILLILSDQMRYDVIGPGKEYPVQTPNMDRFAAQGRWFTQAFSPIPVCCPARQSMLAGRRAETFGGNWNYGIGMQVASLPPEHYNWVREYKDNGYHTAFLGKWSISQSHGPEAFGFDDVDLGKSYAAMRKEKYPDFSFPKEKYFLGHNDPVDVEDSYTHYLAGMTIDRLERYAGQDTPWVMSVNFPEPHPPCQPSEPFSSMYDPKAVQPWKSWPDTFENKPYIQKQQLVSWELDGMTWEDWQPVVARYYGIVSQFDQAFGRIMDALDRLNIADNTVVIYSSDHGDMCGGHGMLDKHYVLYEDNTHVPLGIRWPGHVQPGQSDELVCHSLDLVPTLRHIAQFPEKPANFPDYEFHGHDMTPMLKGEKPADWPEFVVATYNGQQFGLFTHRMYRTDRWKYIWNLTDVDELYDLDNDPGELKNLIYQPDLKPMIQDMRKALYRELERTGDPMVVGNPWMVTQLYEGKKL